MKRILSILSTSRAKTGNALKDKCTSFQKIELDQHTHEEKTISLHSGVNCFESNYNISFIGKRFTTEYTCEGSTELTQTQYTNGLECGTGERIFFTIDNSETNHNFFTVKVKESYARSMNMFEDMIEEIDDEETSIIADISPSESTKGQTSAATSDGEANNNEDNSDTNGTEVKQKGSTVIIVVVIIVVVVIVVIVGVVIFVKRRNANNNANNTDNLEDIGANPFKPEDGEDALDNNAVDKDEEEANANKKEKEKDEFNLGDVKEKNKSKENSDAFFIGTNLEV